LFRGVRIMNKKISYKEAIERIQRLKYTFIGNRDQLHEEIDRIIVMTKKE